MPPVYEALLLNTVVPQIQAAQAGDSYVMVVNATTPALRITQTGTGDSILVEDAANPDSSPFVVTAAGDVGIGTSSPQAKLQVFNQIKVSDSTQAQGALVLGDGGSTSFNVGIARWNGATNAAGAGGVGYFAQGSSNAGGHYFYTGDAQAGSTTLRMTLDASGNLGLGVTPKTWSAGPAIEVGNYYLKLAGSGTYGAVVLNNAYYNGGWKFAEANWANMYQTLGGVHSWHTSTIAGAAAGDPITFTQAMTLDASGNLGVGTTSPGARVDVSGSGSNAVALIQATRSDLSITTAMGSDGGLSGGFIRTTTNHPLVLGTNNAERARITSGGYFKASDNGTYKDSTGTYHEIYQSANATAAIVSGANASLTTSGIFLVEASRNTTDNTFYALGYYNNGASAFKFRVADSGDVTNTNGTYGTISDQKMKTDIVDAGSQWSDIKALRFRKFKMKDDPSGLVQLGVVAQEVELTSPGLVDEHTDRDAEGNDLGTTTKSVKTSVLLMKAAVALQEAMARIETLEAKIAVLESKGA